MYVKLTRYKKEGKHTHFFAFKDIEGKITEHEFLGEKTTGTQGKTNHQLRSSLNIYPHDCTHSHTLAYHCYKRLIIAFIITQI